MSAEGVVDAARTVRPGTPTRSDETDGERSQPGGHDEQPPGGSGNGDPVEPPGRTSVDDT